MVHVVITGGLGFLGVQAARRFLRSGQCWSRLADATRPIQKLTLFDRIPLPEDHLPPELTYDHRLKVLSGDLADPGIVDEVLDLTACDGDVAVIHLASMVSGDTELQPAAGWQANVESQRIMLDALTARAQGARFIFTSSTAALGPVPTGGAAPDDLTKLLPQNTYGFHKAVCELMLNDYSRRGWVDGRGLRLPVIAVRPGAPNAATTGAWSSVVREPLNGQDCEIPIPVDVPMPVASYQTAIEAMLLLMNEVTPEQLGADRTLCAQPPGGASRPPRLALSSSPAPRRAPASQPSWRASHPSLTRARSRRLVRHSMLPSLQLQPAELYAAAEALAAAHGLPLGAVHAKPQEMPTRVVRGMGSATDGGRARALGLPQDASAESIVQAYAEDHVLNRSAAEPEDPDVADYRT